MGEQGVQERYRKFRKAVLKSALSLERIYEKRSSVGSECAAPRWAEAREAITRFRESVAEQVDALLASDAGNDVLVRRALRLDLAVPLAPPSRWAAAGQLLLRVMPVYVAGLRMRRWLARCGTFEGRKLLFERFLAHTLPGSPHYYWSSMDYALMWFDPVRSHEDLVTLQQASEKLLRIARAMGVRRIGDIAKVLLFDSRCLPSEHLLVLVQEGVIQKQDELLWASMQSDHFRHPDPDGEHVIALRACVRCLLSHRVTREQVAGILRYSFWGLNPSLLEANIGFLAGQGITDATEILRITGDRIWRTPTGTWRYVVQSIGVRRSSDLAAFLRVLDCHDPLSDDLVALLRELGAGQEDLQTCQALLLGLRPGKVDDVVAMEGIRCLMGAPYGLNFEQLSQCLTYLQSGGAAAYLAVLAEHGFHEPAAVIAFQACYRNLDAPALSQCLGIMDFRSHGETLEDVAAWVRDAGVGGHFGGYHYLVGAGLIPDLRTLRQALKLVPLGTPFLHYLVEVCGLKSLKAIRDWYYAARGIEGYKSWSTFDAVDRVLVDDAYARNQFNHLESNQAVVSSIARERAQAQIGPWPYQGSESVQERYRKQNQELIASIRESLLPDLQTVLLKTGGVLVSTVFCDDGEGPGYLERQLRRLVPLMDKLLIGEGPKGSALSPLERDAVALVYRTSPSHVAARWHEVIGREQDVNRLKLRSRYPMTWHQVRWKLSRPLDRSGFEPLLVAAHFSEGFGGSRYTDIFTACKRLSPKQLRDGAVSASMQTLALHLGSLLAVAAGHENLLPWMRGGFEALARMDEDSLEAYQRLTALVDFFNVAFPDALDARTEVFVNALSDADAAHWAKRLGPCPAGVSGHDGLRAMLQRCRERVLPFYRDWAHFQQRRFKKDKEVSAQGQSLDAIVSKHPAAFFARSAVQLCTAGNVAMWREDRLFHLVVFDVAGRRFAGMALLYVQNIPELDQLHPSLVLRAINPTDEMLAGHSAASIVESFFNVAVSIAEENNLSCVAFPALSGMHIMSNREMIETYIAERYAQPRIAGWRLGASRQQSSPRGPVPAFAPSEMARPQINVSALREKPQKVAARFYAYEHGCEPVGALHVIWRAQERVQPPGSAAPGNGQGGVPAGLESVTTTAKDASERLT